MKTSRKPLHKFVATLGALTAFAISASAQQSGVMLYNSEPGSANEGKAFGWTFGPFSEYTYDTLFYTWEIVIGGGDFDGDGWADVLVHDTWSDELVIWKFMDSLFAGIQYMDATLAPGEKVVGVNDFNGDLVPDLLIQDASSNLTVWTMGGYEGTQIQDVIFLGSSIIGGTDRYNGFTDVTSDGLADVVLNRTKKDLIYWESTGTDVVRSGSRPQRFSLLTMKDKGRLHGYGRTNLIGTLNGPGSIIFIQVRENKPGNRYSLWSFNGSIGVGFDTQDHIRNASFKKPVSAGEGY